MSAVDPLLDRDLARSCWHLVAHRSELARDRDFVRLEWPLGELVLYNDKGEVIAFDNLCPHRGARFFLEGSGNAPALCPYHGWSYRGGRLRIPKPSCFKPCDLDRARLNRFRVAWCGDLLFAGLEPASGLDAQLGDLFPTLAALSGDMAGRRAADGYRYGCPWRIAVENALEPDHVHMVHPDTLGLLELRNIEDRFHGRNSVLSAELGNERAARRLDRIARLFDAPAASPRYTAIFVFPFAFLTTTYGYSYALQCFMPSKDGTDTHFSSRLFGARLRDPAAEAMAEPFFASVAALNREVFAEDAAICRRVDPDFPMDGPGAILSDSEVKVRHFRDGLAAFRRRRPAEWQGNGGTALSAAAD